MGTWRPDKIPWKKWKAQDYLKWGHYYYYYYYPSTLGVPEINPYLHGVWRVMVAS